MKNDSNQNFTSNRGNVMILELIDDIRRLFGLEVAQKLKNIRFFHEGFQNLTFIGKYEDLWVQIRKPKGVVKIDYSNETKVVSIFKDYLYAKNGFLIKKWFPGQDLFKVNITEDIETSIFQCLTNFRLLNIKLEPFDWKQYDIKDKRYNEIVEKYKNDPLVLSHNNLKRHNILINKYGFIKLIDFEYSTFNSPYVDLVSLYLFLGISKERIIKYFKLDEDKFEDYVYLIQTFNEEVYKQVYSHVKTPDYKINDSLSKFHNKDYTIQSRFIVQKYHNEWDNRLTLDKIKDFYFVPMCVYEDKDRIIWRWLNCAPAQSLSLRQIKVLARAIKLLHESKVKFPSYILKEKTHWYLDKVKKDVMYKEISEERVKKIVEWTDAVKPNANCHNNLSLENIYFADTMSIYIIDWAVAYYSNKYLDIAYLFEHVSISKAMENAFWKSYEDKEPKDFWKYRVIVHFTAYLYNKILNGDFTQARINLKRIDELFETFEGKEDARSK
ncbi:thiamine kinase-like enzyme [Metamycoplasma subdolum]|uniref:Thiamine kinase-like enzyme n=1 Tax=Metamycoplasma subdolum TaxID=92407 RepID=A0A3M0A0F2_9BACT|nr:hypothetical protein [Metamycoplasma subdolum]RMA78483.1 thiamine kinase-like enzyme [Metamycoplasma subdolum]WPB50415.1 hypothetical protein R9C05_02310 [Metamycoplasma subdolum]